MYVYIYIVIMTLPSSYLVILTLIVWRFPKIGRPLAIIHFIFGWSHEIYHTAFLGYPHSWKSPYGGFLK